MIIYLHDQRSPWQYRKFNKDESTSDVKIIVVSQYLSISKIVSIIVNAANHRRSIWKLILLAHGNSGQLQLGRGIGLTSKNAYHFRNLRNYFNPRGKGIEIHGCGVASATAVADDPKVGLRGMGQSGAKGDLFLLILSRESGVPVAAAIDAQRVDYDGIFNGPYIKVWPNGNLQLFQGQKIPLISKSN